MSLFADLEDESSARNHRALGVRMAVRFLACCHGLEVDVVADWADLTGEAAVSIIESILLHWNRAPAVNAAKTILNLVEEDMGLRDLRNLWRMHVVLLWTLVQTLHAVVKR